MEGIQKGIAQHWGKAFVALIVLAIIMAYTSISSMDEEAQELVLEFFQDYLPLCMFVTLAILLFSGFPVAFILGGLAFLYGILGYFLNMFSLIEFFNFLPRIWFQGAENLVLVAVPAFVFMGVMMERSGVANDLLYCVQVLLKNVAGSLALAVIVMGTVLAAMTGIIGASVTMMTAAYDDKTRLQELSFLRLHRSFRHAGHPDPAQHHADYHGGPHGRLSRQHVYGRYCPRTGPGFFLFSVRRGLREGETTCGSEPTARTIACAQKQISRNDI